MSILKKMMLMKKMSIQNNNKNIEPEIKINVIVKTEENEDDKNGSD